MRLPTLKPVVPPREKPPEPPKEKPKIIPQKAHRPPVPNKKQLTLEPLTIDYNTCNPTPGYGLVINETVNCNDTIITVNTPQASLIGDLKMLHYQVTMLHEIGLLLIVQSIFLLNRLKYPQRFLDHLWILPIGS